MTGDSTISGDTEDQRRKKEADARGLTDSFNNPQSTDDFLYNFMLFLARLFNPEKPENETVTGQISDALGFDASDNHRAYRDWHRRQRDSNWENPQAGAPAGNMDAARAAAVTGSATAPAAAGRAASAEVSASYGSMTGRQQRVVSVLADAARTTGVPTEFMVGLWGYESGYGKRTISPTGCRGDFQFTRATMREVIQKHGVEIADRLRAQGLEQDANMVLRQINGRGTNRDIDALRDNPEISAYAAAFYVRDVSQRLRLNPNEEKNWGYMYAGYNIGVGNARKLMAGQQVSGYEVDVNFGARTSERNYRTAIMTKAEEGSRFAFAAAAVGDTPAATVLAENQKPAATPPLRPA